MRNDIYFPSFGSSFVAVFDARRLRVASLTRDRSQRRIDARRYIDPNSSNSSAAYRDDARNRKRNRFRCVLLSRLLQVARVTKRSLRRPLGRMTLLAYESVTIVSLWTLILYHPWIVQRYSQDALTRNLIDRNGKCNPKALSCVKTSQVFSHTYKGE